MELSDALVLPEGVLVLESPFFFVLPLMKARSYIQDFLLDSPS